MFKQPLSSCHMWIRKDSMVTEEGSGKKSTRIDLDKGLEHLM